MVLNVTNGDTGMSVQAPARNYLRWHRSCPSWVSDSPQGMSLSLWML